MPKNNKTLSKAETEQKLRAAQAEIKRLRRKTRDCVCGPYTEADRMRDVRELCEMINKLPAEAYDQEKLKARGLPCPPPPIELPKKTGRTW